MKTTKKVGGAAIATAAALLIGSLAAGTASAADEAKIKCQGVNACKGQSACKSSQHACKGMNSCKGQGSVEMTKSDCKTAQAKAKSASKSAS